MVKEGKGRKGREERKERNLSPELKNQQGRR
jgi:hypothetical protein